MGLTELRQRREAIISVAEQHGAHNLRVFGSAARDQTKASSDIDLLVELEPKRSLLDQVDLVRDLEEMLGCRVDVVEPEGLHWFIRDRVLKEAIPL